jgi:hypothetical protein
MAAYVYRPDVLRELEKHGVRPGATTPPALVHEFVSDLYRFELRRLRGRLLRREVSKEDYAGKVIELRRKYPLVSLASRYWIVSRDE